MDASFWEAENKVIEYLKNEGSSNKIIANHKRSIKQLARHLDDEGVPCTKATVSDWLDFVYAHWSIYKFKDSRIAANRLLEVLETGWIAPNRHSHFGLTDYEKLSGWALRTVDRYVFELRAECLSEGTINIAKRYAAQFLVETGIAELSSPLLITPEVILTYITVREGTKGTRCSRLSYVRGLLSSMARAGEASAWAPMLADDRFANYTSCYLAPPSWNGSPGVPADDVLATLDAIIEQMKQVRYSSTQLNVMARCLHMLYITLALNGESYSAAKGKSWLENISGELGKQLPMYRKALAHLNSFLTTGHIEPDSIGYYGDDPLNKLPSWARDDVAAYLDLRRREGCAKSTIDATRNASVRLATFADAAGCKSWADLDASLVASWCIEDPHNTAEGRLCYVAKARGLLDYLADEGLTRPGLSIAARAESAPRQKVADVLTEDQVEQAEKARTKASSPIELRDAAAIALGLTMGLRASDVAGLEMKRISWSRSSITLVQQKTMRQLELPLSTQAGNAIVAYLRYGRPESTSPQLFVKHRAPYSGITRSACKDAMRRTFKGKTTDFHCLRRTFATMMLRGGSDRRGVAEALGHATTETVDEYLSLDPARMSMCALSLRGFGLEVPQW